MPIYQIKNLQDDKIYIGSTKSIKIRWNQHRRQLRMGNHYNIHLQRAWNKYGEDSFSFEVLEECSEVELIEREQYWLDNKQSYNKKRGYNVAIRADRSIFSQEAKDKIRLALQGRKATDETKKKKSIAMKGKYIGENSNSVILDWHKVRKIREEYLSNSKIYQRQLAEKYGVARTTVQSILNNKSWKDNNWKSAYENLLNKKGNIRRNRDNNKTHKKCGTCLVNKNIIEFYYSSAKKCYSSECKECRKEASRNQRAKRKGVNTSMGE